MHTFLIAAPVGRDAELMCAQLQASGIPCQSSRDIVALCEELPNGVGAILVTEEALTRGFGQPEDTFGDTSLTLRMTGIGPSLHSAPSLTTLSLSPFPFPLSPFTLHSSLLTFHSSLFQ